MFTKKKQRKMKMEIYSTIGATTVVNAGMGITALVLSIKANKKSKAASERLDQMEMHVSKDEEQITRLTKAVRIIQDSAERNGFLASR